MTTNDSYSTAYLLAGPGAPWPPSASSVHDLDAPDAALASWLVQAPRAAVAAYWLEHEPELLAAAARLGVAPQWPGRTYYAQFLAERLEAA